MPLPGRTEPSEFPDESRNTPEDRTGGGGTVEANLERIRQHLQALIDAEPECVKLVAPDGTLLDMNAAGVAMVEASSVEELRGRSVFDLVVPEHRARYRAMHERVCAGGNESLEFEITGMRGTRRWLETHAVPLRQDGFPTPVQLAITRDVTARKQAEEALRQSEQKYRALVETSHDLIWSVDTEGRWTFVNRQGAMSIYGYEPAEMLGRRFTDFQTREQSARDLETFRQIKGGQPVFRCETQHVAKDGRTIDLSFNAIPLVDDEGRVIGTTGTARDITAANRAGIELERQRAELQLVFDAVPALIFTKDLQHRLVRLNQEFVRLTGRPLDELAGRTDAEAGSPHAALYHRDEDDIVASGLPKRNIIEPFQAAGGTRWLRTDKFPYHDATGQIVGVIGFAVDITERLQAEATIEQQRRCMEGIVNAAMDGIITIDEEQRVVVFNAAAERIFRCPAAAVLGRSIEQLIPERFRAKHPEHVRQFGLSRVTTRTVGTFGMVHGVRADGEEFPMESSISQIEVDSRKLFTVTCRDVTERVRAQQIREHLEEQLLQAQKMEAVGQLAGGIAHDFNNLLTIILGYSESVMENLHERDPLRGQVAEISNAGRRAATLTRQLLAFSRKQILAPRVIDLNDQVAATERMLKRLIGEDVRLSTILDPALCHVEVDPGQIEQVILNLAVNARDAMPHGGHLTIETRNVEWDDALLRDCPDIGPGRHVMLSVIDTGCGMTPEVRSHIFDPFFTTKPPDKGTGLGLATVYGIVTQSGGQIVVETEVDVGTAFRIVLPAARGKPAGEEPLGHLPACPGCETVLLVEDEDRVRELAGRVLSNCGYTVLEASGGREAIGVSTSHPGPIDILVTDVVMPEMSGRQLAEVLTSQRPGIRVLYMSGYIDDAVVRHGIIETQRAFLPKPFTSSSLAKKVREVLEATV